MKAPFTIRAKIAVISIGSSEFLRRASDAEKNKGSFIITKKEISHLPKNIKDILYNFK